MINYKPKHGDMEMWMICTVIGENHKLIDKMKKMRMEAILLSFRLVELNWILVE